MRRLVLAALFVPGLAWAQRDPPKTVELPAALVDTIANYLVSKPWAEVNTMVQTIHGCLVVQVPNENGATVSHGECPAVTQAIEARAKQLADAKAPKEAPKP